MGRNKNQWDGSPWCFRHPFLERTSYEEEDTRVADFALTLPEQRMVRLSYAIRSKPFWWIKYKDQTIREKWKTEAMEQEVLGGKATEAEVNYVLDELEEYERLRDEQTGAEVACHHRIWQSDTLIPETLRQQLISEASTLESVPEDEKDWHPRANNQVLDLVHPSLYCLVYGRTLGYPPIDKCPVESRTSKDLWVIPGPQPFIKGPNTRPRFLQTIEDWAMSQKFSWIPTDFVIAEDGKSAKPVSYINNIHPSHTGLCSAVSQVIAHFSHLFDRVLTDLHPANEVSRRIEDNYYYTDDEQGYPSEEEGEGYEAYDERVDNWQRNRPIVIPTVPQDGYQANKGQLEKRDVKYTIQGRECQIIVKLANIHLTPENPTYSGGSWHVEGMGNERIVASGIYYYDSENIIESQLEFRASISFGYDWYEQSDSWGVKRTYGLDRDGENNQHLGAISTIKGRCIAFPNVYQHRVSPFELIDKTKPGHRKIIALFLVDPTLGQSFTADDSTGNKEDANPAPFQPKIPSTTDIPPQQSHWTRNALNTDNIPPSNPFHKLPLELIDNIAQELQTHDASNLGATMTLDEAKKYRLELMDERTVFVQVQDDKYFVSEFNMCEH